MQVDFEEVYLRNFGSHKDTQFRFTPGKHLIVGGNGSGKSTLGDSLIAVLYKETREQNPSFMNEGDAEILLNMTVNGDSYSVGRHWFPQDKVKSPHLSRNGSDLGLRKIQETEREIQKLIPIPLQVFSSVVVVRQGLPSCFARMTPTVRKTMIEDLFGDSVWDSLKKKFSKDVNAISKDVIEAQREFNQTMQKMVSLNSRIDTAKQFVEVDRDESQRNIQDSEREYGEAEKAYKDYCDQNSQWTDQNQKLAIENHYQVLNTRINQLRDHYQNKKKILTSGKCYECHRPYPEEFLGNVREEMEHCLEEGKKLKEESLDYAKAKDTFDQVAKQLWDLDSKRLAARNLLNSLKQKVTEKKETVDLAKEEVELENLNALATGYKENLDAIQTEFEALEYIVSLLKPSSQFRSANLKDRISYLNQIIASITPYLLHQLGINCSLVVEGNGIELDLRKLDRKIEYKSLSGGEKRRVDLSLIFAFQKYIQESSGFKSNLLIFDEIFENLDSPGVTSVLDCIEVLFPDASCIYVISHNEAIKSQFSSVIRVTKVDSISHVEG